MKYAIKDVRLDTFLSVDDLAMTPRHKREDELGCYGAKENRAVFRDPKIAHTVCNDMCGAKYAKKFVVVKFGGV